MMGVRYAARTAARETTHSFLRRGDIGVGREHDLAVDARAKNNQDHDAEELCHGFAKDLSARSLLDITRRVSSVDIPNPRPSVGILRVVDEELVVNGRASTSVGHGFVVMFNVLGASVVRALIGLRLRLAGLDLDGRELAFFSHCVG